MTQEEVLNIFQEAGAILQGHFILTSGRRSAIYLHKAKVFMYPQLVERLCHALAEKIKKEVSFPVDYLVGPAIGGLIPCYETARHLNVPAIWVEREDRDFVLKRFEIPQRAKIIIIEDILTTGLSIKETIAAMEKEGAEIVAAACLIDRSGGKVDVGVPLISLCKYEVPSYDVENLPAALAALPPVKLGSRKQ